MIVAGASRHAKEVIQILEQNNDTINFLFDDVSLKFDNFFIKYSIIRDIKELICNPEIDFVLALGGTKARRLVYEKLINVGKKPLNVISNTAVIGKNNVILGNGTNIMHFVFVSENTSIGTGCLINAFASIHHDVVVSEFVEISPRATLLGGVQVGKNSSIGAGAVILPNVVIGENCVIGAGSVVTKDLPDNALAFGVPSKIIKYIK